MSELFPSEEIKRHPLEQAVYDDYFNTLDLCVNIAYLIEQSKVKDKFKDISDLVLKRAAGAKMMVDHMDKQTVIKTKK